MGCEARKIPAEGDVFFLDFSLYRTYRELANLLVEAHSYSPPGLSILTVSFRHI